MKTATAEQLATINARRLDFVARDMACTGVVLTHEQAADVGELGVEWMRRVLELKISTTDAGVECAVAPDHSCPYGRGDACRPGSPCSACTDS